MEETADNRTNSRQGNLTFPGNFFVLRRLGGANISFARIPRLENAPADDRLMAAFLRKDKAAALQILSAAADAASQHTLCSMIRHSNLAALVFDHCCAMGLEKELSAIADENGNKLLSNMQRSAAVAAARFAKLEAAFEQVTGWLSDFGRSTAWLKGPALARSLYAQPHFRLSEDFDLFIDWSAAESVLERLQAHGYEPEWTDGGQCHQFGVGPVGSLRRLSLIPDSEFEPCHNLTLRYEGAISIELKFDPLERGLKMKERQRFCAQCHPVGWSGYQFYAPDTIDHLMLELTHLHKHSFSGWQWLYDIHLLCLEVGKISAWGELIRRCRTEAVESSAWAGLGLVKDRLHSPVPEEVLRELEPRGGKAAKAFLFTADTEFLWNSASLPGLMMNAFLLGDSRRKWRVLVSSAMPSSEFLSQYYLNGAAMAWWQYPAVLLIHWLVILLPGGLVRRTFGRFLFRSASDD